MNTHERGLQYEQRAADYLTREGYHILERNYRSRYGEIDIVATDRNYLVFVEVKYRKNSHIQYPAEAVNAVKQARICKCALYYMKQQRIDQTIPVRFDVLSILGEKIVLYRNAFDFIY